MIKMINMKMNCFVWAIHLWFISLHLVSSLEVPDFSYLKDVNKLPVTKKPVSPCRACRSLVKSFLKAVEETTRKSFEGGDAAWEREKLGRYENSELRFIEIQEKICKDVDKGKEQCYNLAENHESLLEDWFFEKRKKNVSLLDFLCINNLKICCPDNFYGPNCVPCPGGSKSPCGGHGKCKNGGTRAEPARCLCDKGYSGDLCDSCSKGYYRDIDSSTLLCKMCDISCKDHCRGPGPKNCEVCSTGYQFIPEQGCVVISDDDEDDDEEEEDNKDDSKNSENISNDTELSTGENAESSFEDNSFDRAQQLSKHSEL